MNGPVLPFSPAVQAEAPLIGGILIDAGRLSAADAERILAHQRQHGTRFGESGRKLGLLDEEAIRFALSRQFRYPVMEPGRSPLAKDLVAALQPYSDRAERIRQLRGQLLMRWFDGDPARHALAIVGTGAGEGCSYVAANLAVSLAQLGRPTLLIDADLRRPVQHRLFGLPDGAGLSQLLNDRCAQSPIQGIEHLEHLAVLPAGPVPPNPQELLSRPSFARTLGSCARSYAFIVIDTPPLASCGDALVAARGCGGALVVGRRNRSRLGRISAAIDMLRAVAVLPVGTVENDP